MNNLFVYVSVMKPNNEKGMTSDNFHKIKININY